MFGFITVEIDLDSRLSIEARTDVPKSLGDC